MHCAAVAVARTYATANGDRRIRPLHGIMRDAATGMAGNRQLNLRARLHII